MGLCKHLTNHAPASGAIGKGEKLSEVWGIRRILRACEALKECERKQNGLVQKCYVHHESLPQPQNTERVRGDALGCLTFRERNALSHKVSFVLDGRGLTFLVVRLHQLVVSHHISKAINCRGMAPRLHCDLLLNR